MAASASTRSSMSAVRMDVSWRQIHRANSRRPSGAGGTKFGASLDPAGLDRRHIVERISLKPRNHLLPESRQEKNTDDNHEDATEAGH